VLSTIAAAQTGGSAATPLTITNGFGLAFHVATGLALAGALIAAFLLREPAEPEVVRLPRTTEEREHEALAA
jgi:hypothetical protein